MLRDRRQSPCMAMLTIHGCNALNVPQTFKVAFESGVNLGISRVPEDQYTSLIDVAVSVRKASD